MLLGGDAGHGIEDVGVVGGAFVDGPVFHGDGDGVGDGGIELGAFLDRLLKLFEYGFGEAFAHDFFADDIGCEQVLHRGVLEVDARCDRFEVGDCGNSGRAGVSRPHGSELLKKGLTNSGRLTAKRRSVQRQNEGWAALLRLKELRPEGKPSELGCSANRALSRGISLTFR